MQKMFQRNWNMTAEPYYTGIVKLQYLLTENWIGVLVPILYNNFNSICIEINIDLPYKLYNTYYNINFESFYFEFELQIATQLYDELLYGYCMC